MAAACSRVRQPSSTSSPARASNTARLVPHAPAPMIAARRIGGSPPSHSHWSMTIGQIRSVTAPASAGDAFSTLGNCSVRPARSLTLRGRIRQPLRMSSVPMIAIGTTGAPVSSASRPTPRLRLAERAGAGTRALGEHQHDLAPPEDDLRRLDRVLVARAPVHRERPERVQQPAQQAVVREQLLLGHVVHRAAGSSSRSRTGRRSSDGSRPGSPGPRRGCARARSAPSAGRSGRTASGSA